MSDHRHKVADLVYFPSKEYGLGIITKIMYSQYTGQPEYFVEFYNFSKWYDTPLIERMKDELEYAFPKTQCR